jgi:tetratricopeptide (TPR) repeat protein
VPTASLDILRRDGSIDRHRKGIDVHGSQDSVINRRQMRLAGWGALALLSLVVCGGLGSGWALAASNPQGCVGGGNASNAPNLIAACTRVIDGGGLDGRALANVYSLRAEGFRLIKDNDRALADFTRAIKADPDFSYSYLNRAELHRGMGNFADAIEDASHSIRLDPSYNAAYTIRGLAYEAIGNNAAARADFEKALTIPVKGTDGNWAQQVARGRLKAGHP